MDINMNHLCGNMSKYSLSSPYTGKLVDLKGIFKTVYSDSDFLVNFLNFDSNENIENIVCLGFVQ